MLCYTSMPRLSSAPALLSITSLLPLNINCARRVPNAFWSCCRVQLKMRSSHSARYDAKIVNTFLHSSREVLAHTESSIAATVFLGNEACDLDSAACALALAYSEHARGAAALPVLNIPRAEIALRRDLVHLLHEAGIELSALTFIDEVNLGDVLERGGGLTLVDHNELATHQTDFGPHVTRIVDHHADTRNYSAARRAVRRTGSCASVVGMEIVFDIHIPPPLAFLLLSAVLIDTHCLERRTVDEDEVMAKRFCEIGGVPQHEWPILRKKISKERSKVDGFTARELLLKDYKCFAGSLGRAGISSVSEGIAEWSLAMKCRLSAEVLAGMQREKDVDAMMVMSSFQRNGQFCREILIYGESNVARLLRNHLPKCEYMDLLPMSIPELPDAHCFSQKNLEASRKVTAPQVQRILSGYMGSTSIS